jgi:hypothetical protein
MIDADSLRLGRPSVKRERIEGREDQAVVKRGVEAGDHAGVE